MFQLKVDPLTGNSEWVVIEEDEASGDATKQLLANTSYLDMLNDTRRNKAYREAIDKTITKPCHVLDIGYSLVIFSLTKLNYFEMLKMLSLSRLYLLLSDIIFVVHITIEESLEVSVIYLYVPFCITYPVNDSRDKTFFMKNISSTLDVVLM